MKNNESVIQYINYEIVIFYQIKIVIINIKVFKNYLVVYMKNLKKIAAWLITIFIMTINKSFSQPINPKNSFINQNFIISLDGGIAYGFTDYKNSGVGLAAKGSLEYYPLIIKDARFGFKIFGGGLNLKFDDPRKSVSSNDGPREIPGEVSTDAIFFGAGLNFGYAFSEFFIPSITIGGTYLNFSPKNNNGRILEFNSLDRYDKSIFTFTLEGNINFRISDRFSLNTSLTYSPTSTDYLEDLSAANNSDTYLTAMVGLSYAVFGSFDSDGDGIKDNVDVCPDEPEDFDGFQDEDGCPDLDNDGDKIPDNIDKCPDAAEDFDGFEDWDGCPDLDNDKDGIPDVNDKCPNEPEDVDGFQDEDGCPDPDNDKDGILDVNDKCPDEPETKNNFEDEDGCPDVAPNEETFYQFNLRGEDLFINSSSDLKESARLILNEIAFYIQNQPKSKWRIEGHMDSQGSVYTIKKLSYDRAKSVFDYLVLQGVSQNQMEVYGLGDSFPVGNNNTIEGRNANRRIMIIRED